MEKTVWRKDGEGNIIPEIIDTNDYTASELLSNKFFSGDCFRCEIMTRIFDAYEAATTDPVNELNRAMDMFDANGSSFQALLANNDLSNAIVRLNALSIAQADKDLILGVIDPQE